MPSTPSSAPPRRRFSDILAARGEERGAGGGIGVGFSSNWRRFHDIWRRSRPKRSRFQNTAETCAAFLPYTHSSGAGHGLNGAGHGLFGAGSKTQPKPAPHFCFIRTPVAQVQPAKWNLLHPPLYLRHPIQDLRHLFLHLRHPHQDLHHRPTQLTHRLDPHHSPLTVQVSHYLAPVTD